MRTQVGIVGAGPAGLMLSHLLHLEGIDSIIIENRSRDYIEGRIRAGLIEQWARDLLIETGVGERMQREGLSHDGIHFCFDGALHQINFRELVGKGVTIYGQQEVIKDLIEKRLADGGQILFEVDDVSLHDVTSAKPKIRFRHGGRNEEIDCDFIGGCDGFHGICRPSVPPGLLTVRDRDYPYAWLGVTADVPPSTDELIYAHHPGGFALHSLRSPLVSRLYLQVAPDEEISAWPDDRIWAALQRRLAVPGWGLKEGPILDKGITPMRSFVSAPMRHGRLFLAGDAAHIVPPTGAKGLNLALGDVAVLACALEELLRGDPRLADAYTGTCLERVWRRTHFSWWMTTMLHATPGADPLDAQLQLAQLRYVSTSRAAATSLAENYTGYPPRS